MSKDNELRKLAQKAMKSHDFVKVRQIGSQASTERRITSVQDLEAVLLDIELRRLAIEAEAEG